MPNKTSEFRIRYFPANMTHALAWGDHRDPKTLQVITPMFQDRAVLVRELESNGLTVSKEGLVTKEPVDLRA